MCFCRLFFQDFLGKGFDFCILEDLGTILGHLGAQGRTLLGSRLLFCSFVYYVRIPILRAFQVTWSRRRCICLFLFQCFLFLRLLGWSLDGWGLKTKHLAGDPLQTEPFSQKLAFSWFQALFELFWVTLGHIFMTLGAWRRACNSKGFHGFPEAPADPATFSVGGNATLFGPRFSDFRG